MASANHDCSFCGSQHVTEEFPGVFRCNVCRMIEVREGTMTEEQYLDQIPTACFRHDFVQTGTKRSWCKRCNVDGIYNFQQGGYVTHEDDELLSWNTSQVSGRDP